MNALKAALVGAASIVLSAAACAADSATEVLQRLETTHANLRSAAGIFTQTRVDRAVDDKIVSIADFQLLKPNRFRADFRPPRATTILATDNVLYRYVPANRQVERYQFQQKATPQDLTFVLLGFGAKASDILNVYNATRITKDVPAGQVAVKLTPKDKKAAGFRSIVLYISDDARALPLRFLVDQSADVTLAIDLDEKSFKLDSRVSESAFRPNFPKDAEVVDVK